MRHIKLIIIVAIMFFMISCKSIDVDGQNNDKKDITISFNIDGVEVQETIKDRKFINIDDVPISDKGRIDGIYYDKDYQKKYDDSELSDGTTLFVKTNNSFIIRFYDGENYREIRYSEAKVIAYSDIPFDSNLLDKLYYDKSFTREYNGEAINSETNLYLKYKEPLITISFSILGKIYQKGFIEEIVLTNNDVPYVFPNEIVGLYYDKNFTIPYDNSLISSDVGLYVKIDGVDYNKLMKINFVIEGNSYESYIYPGSRISFDNIVGFEFKSLFRGIYLDENYTEEYNNEKITKTNGDDLTFYIKTEDYYVVRYNVKGENIDIKYYSPRAITLDDIPCSNKEKIKAYYLNGEITPYDNSVISSCAKVYVVFDDPIVTLICNDEKKEVTAPYGRQLLRQLIPFDFVSGIYLDESHSIEYDFGLVYDDITLYVTTDGVSVSGDIIDAIKKWFNQNKSKENFPYGFNIGHYYGEYNGFYIFSIAGYSSAVEYDRYIEDMRFSSFIGKELVLVLDKNGSDCVIIDIAYEKGYLSIDDIRSFYDQYLEYNKKIHW